MTPSPPPRRASRARRCPTSRCATRTPPPRMPVSSPDPPTRPPLRGSLFQVRAGGQGGGVAGGGVPWGAVGGPRCLSPLGWGGERDAWVLGGGVPWRGVMESLDAWDPWGGHGVHRVVCGGVLPLPPLFPLQKPGRWPWSPPAPCQPLHHPCEYRGEDSDTGGSWGPWGGGPWEDTGGLGEALGGHPRDPGVRVGAGSQRPHGWWWVALGTLG